jgi:hypothetical protein
MPRGDGTGPAGMGPMTGWGAGYCAGNNAPGFTNLSPGRALRVRDGSAIPPQGLAYGRGTPYGITALGWRCGRGPGRGRGRGRRWFGW